MNFYLVKVGGEGESEKFKMISNKERGEVS